MSAYKRDDKEFKAKLAQLADKKSQLVTEKTVRLPETCPQGPFCCAGYAGGCVKGCPKDYRGPKEQETPPQVNLATKISNFIRRIFNV